jgi:hypothetical protein
MFKCQTPYYLSTDTRPLYLSPFGHRSCQELSGGHHPIVHCLIPWPQVPITLLFPSYQYQLTSHECPFYHSCYVRNLFWVINFRLEDLIWSSRKLVPTSQIILWYKSTQVPGVIHKKNKQLCLHFWTERQKMVQLQYWKVLWACL